MPKRTKPPLKRRAKWWYVIWAMLPALALLLLVEVSLRLAGFGYPTSFFIPAGEGYVKSNERFAWRFMSPELARDPLPFKMASAKPQGTTRIFVLGESAAQGVPEPAFGFSRILEVMLQARYPDKRFEVINTGVTAVNSYAVREIARECLRFQPDLLVVYCGNNEVVGPFGPGTIFQSGMPSLGLARLQLFLSQTRTWQALVKLTNRKPDRQWAGMEMFLNNRVTVDDPRLPKVYDHFRSNLGSVLAASRKMQVPVVLCTVPVNLVACPPFTSVHGRSWAESNGQRWNELFAAGTNAEGRGDWTAAGTAYEKLEQLDPGFAEVNFRRARSLEQLNNPKDALREFSLARDNDALRFRADAKLNETIRTLAQDKGVRLYDAAGSTNLLQEQDKLFYEHVHLKFHGNYVLARGFLTEIEAALSLDRQPATLPKPVPDEGECAAQLAFTPWSRWKTDKVALGMTARPPFTLQIGHAAEFVARMQELDAESAVVNAPEELSRSVSVFADVLKARPNDYLLRRDAIELLCQQGDFKGAIEQARSLETQLPGYAKSKLQTGDVLLSAGQFNEAIQLFREVIAARPEMAEARQSLGDALVKTEAIDEAQTAYEAALARGGDAPELHNNLATILIRKGDLESAARHLRRALEWTDDPIWHANLGGLFFMQKKYAEALPEFRRAVALMPQNAAMHDNLGQALLAQGKNQEAGAEFQAALQIEPGYEAARQHLAQAQGPP